MSKVLWILGAATLAIAAYVVMSQPLGETEDGINEAASNLGGWGNKQRAFGIGGQLKGRVEQGAANLTGNPDTASKGVLDEATGVVKNAAGKAAQAVSDSAQNLSK